LHRWLAQLQIDAENGPLMSRARLAARNGRRGAPVLCVEECFYNVEALRFVLTAVSSREASARHKRAVLRVYLELSEPPVQKTYRS
jgi:hypothetical protein